MNEELQRLRDTSPMARQFVPSGEPRMRGFNDNVFSPEMFTAGAPSGVLRRAAAERAPLRGTVRVVTVLVDFPDKKITASKEHFEKLFFSESELPHGSVRDYFREVSHGLVDIVGEIIGPVRLPHELSWYANGNFGIGKPTGEPRAQRAPPHARLTAPNPATSHGTDEGGRLLDRTAVRRDLGGGAGDRRRLLVSARRMRSVLTRPLNSRPGAPGAFIGVMPDWHKLIANEFV